jgi:hypothetical protein
MKLLATLMGFLFLMVAGLAPVAMADSDKKDKYEKKYSKSKDHEDRDKEKRKKHDDEEDDDHDRKDKDKHEKHGDDDHDKDKKHKKDKKDKKDHDDNASDRGREMRNENANHGDKSVDEKDTKNGVKESETAPAGKKKSGGYFQNWFGG